MSLTTIQLKRTSGNKTLDDNTVKVIVPAYGEPVFSHTSTIDELVIGDGSTDIEHLPRLTLKGPNAKDVLIMEYGTTTTDATSFYSTVNTAFTNKKAIFVRIEDVIDISGYHPKLFVPLTYRSEIRTGQTNYTYTYQFTSLFKWPNGDIYKCTFAVKMTQNQSTFVSTYAFDAPTVTKEVDSDEKLAVALATSGSTYYPIMGSGLSASTRQYDSTGMSYVGTSGTSNVDGSSILTLGNNKASGTSDNKQGKLVLYGTGTNSATLITDSLTGNRTIKLPDSDATLATVGGDLGVATATTATAGDNSTKVATTSFVSTAVTNAISNNKKVVLPTSQPSPSVEGQLYIDNGMLKYYDGSNWQNVKSIGVWG